MAERFADIESYLASLSQDFRDALEVLRARIKSTVPEAAESMSYGVPTFKYRGRPLTYFGAAKSHCALYGMDATGFEERLAGFDRAKGTIRFQPGRPLPEGVVEEMLRARVAAIDAAAAQRKAKTKKGAGMQP
jgi:uncharacterized protein YdhG (YjbR/CyaY superfamily)